MLKKPSEIYRLLSETISVSKAGLSFVQMAFLGMLAGMFIAFGAIYSMIAISGVELFGIKKLLGGMVFSVGLMMIVIAGAELFTGNVLMTFGVLTKKISFKALVRNWLWVYIFNFVGSIILAWLLLKTYLWGNATSLNEFGMTVLSVGNSKAALSFSQAFFRGMLCNILVNTAVIVSVASEQIMGKILGILFVISAFVASGFEHSVANMFFLPAAMFVKHAISPEVASNFANLSWVNSLKNILSVTAGNIVGPIVFIVLPYYFAYLRKE